MPVCSGTRVIAGVLKTEVSSHSVSRPMYCGSNITWPLEDIASEASVAVAVGLSKENDSEHQPDCERTR